MFLKGSVNKCFVIPPNSQVEKNCEEIVCFSSWLTNLLRFQGAQPDHVRVESSCCCFPKELVGFVRPRELVFWPTTRDMRLQSENVFDLGGIKLLIEQYKL